MKALVFEQPQRAAVRDIDVPEIAADEVLIRSRNVGICHSDFELYEGRYIIPISYPIIPGHEWSGEIAEVGSLVTTLAEGDRVVGEERLLQDLQPARERLRDVRQGPDGAIYLLTDNAKGRILKLVPKS